MEHRNYPVTIKCEQCDKDIVCYNRSKLYPKNKLRRFCDRSCAAKYNNKRRTYSGEVNQKISDKIRRNFFKRLFTGNIITSSSNFRRQARRITDFFEIEHCEYPGCNYSNVLHTHHIKGIKENDITMLALLCPNHHAEIHHDIIDDSVLIPIIAKRLEEYKKEISDIINN